MRYHWQMCVTQVMPALPSKYFFVYLIFYLIAYLNLCYIEYFNTAIRPLTPTTFEAHFFLKKDKNEKE